MTGVVALHGGGEFLAGDEAFLDGLVDAVVAPEGRPAQAIVVPTAAARGRPDLAAANGVAALQHAARRRARDVTVDAIAIVDRTSAGDARLATRLVSADLIHLPGGDPDLIPGLFPGTEAWAAMEVAAGRGAVIAGASAGAMALAELTWTPAGIVPGLRYVPGVIVAPHADARSWAEYVRRFASIRPSSLGVLGLAERTGVIGPVTGPWLVVGEGDVRWLPPGINDPAVALVRRDGEMLDVADAG